MPLRELVLKLEPERLGIVSEVQSRTRQSVGSYAQDDFAWAKGSLHSPLYDFHINTPPVILFLLPLTPIKTLSQKPAFKRPLEMQCVTLAILFGTQGTLSCNKSSSENSPYTMYLDCLFPGGLVDNIDLWEIL